MTGLCRHSGLLRVMSGLFGLFAEGLLNPRQRRNSRHLRTAAWGTEAAIHYVGMTGILVAAVVLMAGPKKWLQDPGAALAGNRAGWEPSSAKGQWSKTPATAIL